MRLFIKILLKAYLLPLTFTEKIKLHIRENYFALASRHLYHITRIIKRNKYNKDEIIIDVGAADGSVSAFFSKQFSENPIYSYEPNPAYLPSLQEKEKRYSKIKIKTIALSNKQDKMSFFITRNSVSSSLKKINSSLLQEQHHPFLTPLDVEKEISVNTNTLDNEFNDYKKNVLLIKLDVQGAELDVLKGGINLLKRTKYILTEMQTHQFYEDASPYHKVDDFLRENGFKLIDMITSYRHDGIYVDEYDAIYKNLKYEAKLS